MNTIKVRKFSDVDTTKYTEGSIFISEDYNAGILVGGKIKEITGETLSRYQISKMIEKALKEVKKDDK